MLTRTSEIAVKALITMVLHHEGKPVTTQALADRVGCAPSYLAKTLGRLAGRGILKSRRGPQGGVELARKPGAITLLEIVEACQGLLISNYCQSIGDEDGPVCAFHRAMWEVRMATRDALARWSLEDLARRPGPTGKLSGNGECHLAFLLRKTEMTRCATAANPGTRTAKAKGR